MMRLILYDGRYEYEIHGRVYYLVQCTPRNMRNSFLKYDGNREQEPTCSRFFLFFFTSTMLWDLALKEIYSYALPMLLKCCKTKPVRCPSLRTFVRFSSDWYRTQNPGKMFGSLFENLL